MLVVTNCTSRKASLGGPILTPQLDAVSTITDLARHWTDAARATWPRCTAAKLYQGRSMQEASASAQAAGARLCVLSAGFGLVHSTAELPEYSLTVSQGEGSIGQWLRHRGYAVHDWWEALTSAWGQDRPLLRLLDGPSRPYMLLALPASYVAMIAGELEDATTDHIDRLRVFTSAAGLRLLPSHIHRAWMPYDQRIDSIAGYAGTQVDFPQRALRHFVNELEGHHLSTEKAVEEVVRAQCNRETPRRPLRQRLSDEQILELLRSQWTTTQGSSTKLLRFLRDSAQVACEQKRFRSLWQQARAMERQSC